MKITLFNLSRTLSSDGSRLISALLKRAGHSVTSIFLARSASLSYGADELGQLEDILRDTDLVMVAVYSSYVRRAIEVTEFVHDHYPGLMVVWGGPHCISAPELSLKYADAICYSEGDQATVDLVHRMETDGNFTDTPNMAFNIGGSYQLNGPLPPFTELDSLPFYDYELDDHYLLDQGLFPITKETVRARHASYPYNLPTLYFLTSRGCPNECTYCNNSRYIRIFGHNSLRHMSADRIVDELEHTLNHLDFFELVFFGDDDFLMRSQKQLEEFAVRYRKRIDLPFIIAASANTYSKRKMEILLDAGLKCIQMGVQSGSQRILDEVFRRKVKLERTRQAVGQIATYHKIRGTDLLLDFIIDNPYETPNDVIQTYHYLIDLPLHVIVNVFYLAFFPGTPIYQKALDDGFIEPYQEKASTFKFSTREGIRVRYQKNYEMFLILLVRRLRLRCPNHQSSWGKFVPQVVFRFLGNPLMRKIASVFPESFYSFLCQKIQ